MPLSGAPGLPSANLPCPSDSPPTLSETVALPHTNVGVAAGLSDPVIASVFHLSRFIRKSDPFPPRVAGRSESAAGDGRRIGTEPKTGSATDLPEEATTMVKGTEDLLTNQRELPTALWA